MLSIRVSILEAIHHSYVDMSVHMLYGLYMHAYKNNTNWSMPLHQDCGYTIVGAQNTGFTGSLAPSRDVFQMPMN